VSTDKKEKCKDYSDKRKDGCEDIPPGFTIPA
jgi:hypothetical protein